MENAMVCTHETSRVVVVSLKQGLDVASLSVGGVHEFPGFFESVIDVVAATSPLPLGILGQVSAATRQSAKFRVTIA